ncbi:MAG: hypothetical protein AB7S71_23640 [Dongiaceae bacterium]
MLERLTSFWRRRRVATVEELRELLTAEATYLSQKTTIDYCRARAGLAWPKLVSEPQFTAALDACRWQAMAAVLADMIVVTEGFLRPHLGTDAPRLMPALASTLFAEVLESSPAPDAARADWRGLPDELAARLARAQMAAVHHPGEIARTSGARVFDLLPLHPSVRIDDQETVINSVRFGMVAFSDTLGRAVEDPAGLARRLIAGVPPRP